jgi:hypothetical protein
VPQHNTKKWQKKKKESIRSKKKNVLSKTTCETSTAKKDAALNKDSFVALHYLNKKWFKQYFHRET